MDQNGIRDPHTGAGVFDIGRPPQEPAAQEKKPTQKSESFREKALRQGAEKAGKAEA